MKKEIKLSRPLLVDGREVATLEYDFDEISVDAFLNAEGKALAKQGNGRAGATYVDYGLHLYLMFEAIIAVMKDVTIEDLERVKGTDLIRLQSEGQLFTTGGLVEASEENDSDEQLETTPEPSTLLPQISEGESSESLS